MSTPSAGGGMRHPVLLGLTVALAYCSIVYELLLAQSLAATLGSTFLRYNVTIGFYLASLGLGSLLCGDVPEREGLDRLAMVELALALLGALSPLLVLWGNVASCRFVASFVAPEQAWIYTALAQALNHALIVAIGVLSGYELPLLMGMAGERSNEVLAADYLGTVIGGALFPFLLLPHLGVLETSALTGALNALCGLYVLGSSGGRPRVLRIGAFAAVLGLCCVLYGRREGIHRSCAEGFYCAARARR